MYQRYYKQRKFGRIFSFVLVIGSGLAHYVKSSYSLIRNNFKIENLIKYKEYLPSGVQNFVENFDEIKNGKKLSSLSLSDVKFYQSQKENSFTSKNKYFLYQKNINNLNNLSTNKSLFDKSFTENEIKSIETYILIRKIKKKL